MNTRQLWVTGIMAVLMLGTIFAMPAHVPAKAGSAVRHAGPVNAAPSNRAETPDQPARDRNYH